MDEDKGDHYFAMGEKYATFLRGLVDMMLDSIPEEYSEVFWDGIYHNKF